MRFPNVERNMTLMENLWRRRFHSRQKTLNRRLKARLRRKLKSRAIGSGKRNGFRVLALIDVHWLITYKRRETVMSTITLLNIIDLRTTLLTGTLYNAWHTACSNCFKDWLWKAVQLLRTEFPPTDVINYRHHTNAVVKYIYRTPKYQNPYNFSEVIP